MAAPAPVCHFDSLRLDAHNIGVAQSQFLLALRELMAALGADHNAGVQQFITLRASLCRCFSSALARWFRWLYVNNRAVALNIAGKIQHQAVVSVRLQAHTTASHLHIKSR